MFVYRTCFAGSVTRGCPSYKVRSVGWNSRVPQDSQDVPYNPAEFQGQVGQLSNRYIVISRLIRYERLFISCSGCVTISHKIVLEYVRHSRIANYFASVYRKISMQDLCVSPARIAPLRGTLLESDRQNVTRHNVNITTMALREIANRY